MGKAIKTRRGYNLNIKGEAQKTVVQAPVADAYAVKPPDFHSIIPKMMVKEGHTVLAGDPLFFSKLHPDVKFASPVSGTVREILRGAKRRVLEVIIQPDGENRHYDYGKVDLNNATQIKQQLLDSGCWPFIVQRPYAVVADPERTPKSIFISAYATAPLAADFATVLEGQEQEFQAGIDALNTLVPGRVHLGVGKKDKSFLASVNNAQIHKMSGPHPTGNVGVMIHHIDPVNQGEVVWTVRPEDVAIMGRMLTTGNYNPVRTVALVGQCVDEADRKYYRTLAGARVNSLTKIGGEDVRLISGDVFTGDHIVQDQFLNFYKNELTIIPEGRDHRFFGWVPFTYNGIPSVSRTSLNFLFRGKKQEVDTNMNGEERALVVTGEMEESLPMDIFPMPLIKACLAHNIEMMENLGIYEVAPEDFGVVDFTNTSKIEAQEIIRLGLDLMLTEVG